MPVLVIGGGTPETDTVVDCMRAEGIDTVSWSDYSQLDFCISSQLQKSWSLIDGREISSFSRVVFLDYPQVPRWWLLGATDKSFAANEYGSVLAVLLSNNCQRVCNYEIANPYFNIATQQYAKKSVARAIGLPFVRAANKADVKRHPSVSLWIGRNFALLSDMYAETILDVSIDGIILRAQRFLHENGCHWLAIDLAIMDRGPVCIDVSTFTYSYLLFKHNFSWQKLLNGRG